MTKLKMGKPRRMSKRTHLSERGQERCREIINRLHEEYGGVPPSLLHQEKKKAHIYCSDYTIRKFLKSEGFVYDGALWKKSEGGSNA